MEVSQPGTILSITIAAVHTFFAGYLLVKASLRQRVERWLILFLVASGMWQLSQVVQSIETFSPSRPFHLNLLPFYGLFLFGLLFFHLSYSFLQLDKKERKLWLVSLAWFGVLGALGLNPFAVSADLWQINGRILQYQDIIVFVALLGWFFYLTMTIKITWNTYQRNERRPLHQNRIRYWFLVLGLSISRDVFIIAGHPTVSSLLHLSIIMFITYTMMVYKLPDIRQIIHPALSNGVVILFLAVVYLFGISSLAGMSQTIPRLMTGGLSMTLLLILLYNPMQRLMQRVLERFAPEVEYDANHTLREYSRSISNIVHLGELEAMVVQLISQAMEIRYGTLFLVDGISDGDDQVSYEVSSVQGFGEEKFVLGSFEKGSVVAEYLARERQPLVQFDIDIQPQFEHISEAEREWLSGLGMEVFVPIYTKGKWIGLLGLGPKVAGERYYDEDLSLLRTLADQTAVALENARLVTDLVRVNNDLKQAYSDLEDANRQLKESDELKSSFIGVITHELRTPVSNAIFSLQLLDRYGLEGLSDEQREEMVKLATHVNDSRLMVDNLITFAAFVRQRGRLRPSEFDFIQLIEEVMITLRPLSERKQIEIEVQLPNEELLLHCDRERLSNAVYHLVHNAIKFTDETDRIQVHAWVRAGAVYFEVQDTGIGIPEDKLPVIWDDFVQMADPLRRGTEGLGLGLSLVKYVVEAHNGELFVCSKEYVGSTFGFGIPLNGNTPAIDHTPALLAEALNFDRISSF